MNNFQSNDPPPKKKKKKKAGSSPSLTWVFCSNA